MAAAVYACPKPQTLTTLERRLWKSWISICLTTLIMCGYDFDICCFKARLLQQRDTEASFVYIMTSKRRAIYVVHFESTVSGVCRVST